MVIRVHFFNGVPHKHTRFVLAFILAANWASAELITAGQIDQLVPARYWRPGSFDVALDYGLWIYRLGDLLNLPPPCTGACSFDFSQHVVGEGVAGYMGLSDSGLAAFDLQIVGPVVTATSECDPCLPGYTVYHTIWGPVPFVVTGTITYTELGSLPQVFDVSGIGLARVRTSAGYFLSTGGEIEYEFIPEVNSGQMLLLGAAFLALNRLLAAARRVR